MKLNYKKNKNGFTLIEMMISIFIFALMMTAIAGIFARQISSYKKTRIMANDLENAQFALNYVAKTLRTASIIGYSNEAGYTNLMDEIQSGQNNDKDFYTQKIPVNTSLIIYDFSQEACMRLTFRTDSHGGYDYPALWMESQAGTVGIDDIDKCLTTNWGTTSGNAVYKDQRLTTGKVTGQLVVATTRYKDQKNSRNTDTMGRATISMSVVPAEFADNDNVKPVHIQSSVALRDYPSDLTF